MSWTAPMTAVAGSVFTAAQFNTHVRDNLLETAPARATTAGRHFAVTGSNEIAERASVTDFISTSESTGSASYTDLATIGPTVSVTTGVQAWVFTSAFANNDTAGTSNSFAHEISGASSSSANDNHRGLYVREGSTTGVTGGRFTSVNLRTGLTPGVNTFTMKYKTSGGTSTFSTRTISVLPF